MPIEVLTSIFLIGALLWAHSLMLVAVGIWLAKFIDDERPSYRFVATITLILGNMAFHYIDRTVNIPLGDIPLYARQIGIVVGGCMAFICTIPFLLGVKDVE